MKIPFTQKKLKVTTIVVVMALVLAGLGYAASQNHNSISKSPAINYQDKCANSNTATQNGYSCYKYELTSIVKQTGVEPAVSLLKTQYEKVPYVKSNCHQLMHVIGRAAYDKYGNLADTFAHGSQYCNGGYYHGLSEQLGNKKGVAYLKENANTLCAPIAAKKGRYSFYHYNCVHGLGHAFMEVLDGELFQSLQGCDLISDSWERNSCYGGVFMQNIMIEQSPDESVNHTSKYLNNVDPMYPCTAVEGKYKYQCYLMQTSHALQVENWDFSKVFSLCDASESGYRDTCYSSLGRDASGQSVYSPAKTRDTCLLGATAEGRINCIYGAVQDYVDNFQSDKQAIQICDGLAPEIISDCTNKVTSYYSRF